MIQKEKAAANDSVEDARGVTGEKASEEDIEEFKDIEENIKTSISILSVGPSRDETIFI